MMCITTNRLDLDLVNLSLNLKATVARPNVLCAFFLAKLKVRS